MADVYEVEHLRLKSAFAAKVLRSADFDGNKARRFAREARLLARIRSEHVVKVVDLAPPHAAPPFYVMELLPGRDLRRLLVSAVRLSVPHAVAIVLEACEGVRALHALGIVHRDLKPENLFVTFRDDGRELCKNLDLGVARSDGVTSTKQSALSRTWRPSRSRSGAK
jgi:eukaryotic-like serine/threonine-protein kinase